MGKNLKTPAHSIKFVQLKMNHVNYIEERVQQIFNSRNGSQSVAHKMDHLQRVKYLALEIASDYKQANKETIILAALLHDIDQPYNNKENHVELSKILAGKILQEVNYPQNIVDKVLLIISEHSTENIHLNFSCIESMILFDADKIDGVGATGLTRTFMLNGQKKLSLNDTLIWYLNKIKKALQNLQTHRGKRLFIQRLGFVKDYIKELFIENTPNPEIQKVIKNFYDEVDKIVSIDKKENKNQLVLQD